MKSNPVFPNGFEEGIKTGRGERVKRGSLSGKKLFKLDGLPLP